MGIRRVSGLKPNTDYKFTVKVRINSVVKEKNLNGAAVDVGPFTQHYYSELKNEDGSVEQAKGYMMYTTENWFDGTFDWREVTCYFVSDRKGRADILLYLEGKGTAWFDDVVIAPADFDSEVTEVRRVEGEHTAVIVYTKDIEGLDEQALHNWVRKLDYAYDQMADLMGSTPFGGDKIYFQSSMEPYVVQYEALGTINPIRWSRKYMSDYCVKACSEGAQIGTPYHEMGHNFDMMYPWSFENECTADFKCGYVLLSQKEGTVYPVSEFTPYEISDYINYLKTYSSTSYDKTFGAKQEQKYIKYAEGVTYIMVRCCDAVGWDTVKETFKQFSYSYDTQFNARYSRFLYWLMCMQNNYNRTHPDATGGEIYDSFPKGEYEFFTNTLKNIYGYTEKGDIHCVKFLDPDGNRLWFEFVPHGQSAEPIEVQDHEKYGAFLGWDRDLSNVTSDMTVTANYQNYHTEGTITSSADKDSIYEGEYVEFTVTPDSGSNYSYNIIALRDDTKIYESGYTQTSSAKLFIDKAGEYTVYAQLKDAGGNEYSTSKLYFKAGRAVTIYYSGFNNPNIHYKAENKAWTAVPGNRMTANSDVSGYSYKYVIPITSVGGKAEICFNDGKNNWDNNREQNYKVSEGTYGIKNGTVTQITG